MDIKTSYIQLKKRILEKEYSRMNDMQRVAVFSNQGPLLILAGAGSGKTTVIVNRIAFLIKYGNAYNSAAVPPMVNEQTIAMLQAYLDKGEGDPEEIRNILAVNPPKPWNVLAITFTNKAAGELKNRLESVLGEAALDIWAGTFHSICVRILRREIGALGYDKSFTIYDTDDSVRVIKDCLKELNLSDKQFPPKQMLGAISRLKDEMTDPALAKTQAGGDYKQQKIADVYAQYTKKLKSANALDFDDIICCTVKLFEQFPEVLKAWQNRFAYVMVDEYQDTNHAQYRLVSLISASHKRICVVGDDDQSIYRFRGATIENILSFEHQFEHAEVIRLEQNYRSTQTILNAANAVIGHNTQRKGKELWTSNGAGEQVLVYRASDEMEEAAFIADTIEENVRLGHQYSEHAILYRMNAQSAQIERHFAKAAIPYRIIGGLRFYERKEVKDIIAYLSVINNPADSVRLKRIINEPKRGIGDATVAAAEEIAASLGDTLFQVLSESENYAALSRKAQPLKEFASLIRGFIDTAAETSLEVLFDSIVEETGYMRMLQAQGDEGLTRIENLNELKSNILKYVLENEDATLSGFLEEVSLLTDIDNYDADADAAVMMTMHSAKGLEFPFVFVVGMEEGIFPGMQVMYDPTEVEEERRLAYVAITRAKKRLYITNAASRMLFGQTMRNRPSRFLTEIPLEYKEETGLSVRASRQTVPTYTPPAYTPRNAVASAVSVGSVSKPAQQGVAYAAGERVNHKIFGNGMIISATPMGNDTLLEIAFETKGTKKIMANFTKLEKL
ncbi:ATP-dependent helicase [Acetanaerobacterium elongatum]|uniref:ATP-dependent DNA helicase PcrA n=1 Tax=Acetanaerobacterium elongatum TaxID=258515 RepID=A0A1H0FXC4_9FIRM|nr:UvrD-helicase domain-containing protein [Acetanaerobacterium elongatum]SDN99214.1 DNA helicase-2 / ATP-dependent DNA helicase PcrA [Acetanaerobacterium elongatum]